MVDVGLVWVFWVTGLVMVRNRRWRFGERALAEKAMGVEKLMDGVDEGLGGESLVLISSEDSVMVWVLWSWCDDLVW
ncbi:hypothetical protein V6N13_016185 [Hibiscus sabdariffa]